MNMSWYAFLEQNGGCDYTIGCGVALTKLAATSEEQALQEVKEIYGNDFQNENENSIQHVTLFEVNREINIDHLLLAEKVNKLQTKLEINRLENKEKRRKEYEDLKKEFGDVK